MFGPINLQNDIAGYMTCMHARAYMLACVSKRTDVHARVRVNCTHIYVFSHMHADTQRTNTRTETAGSMPNVVMVWTNRRPIGHDLGFVISR